MIISPWISANTLAFAEKKKRPIDGFFSSHLLAITLQPTSAKEGRIRAKRLNLVFASKLNRHMKNGARKCTQCAGRTVPHFSPGTIAQPEPQGPTGALLKRWGSPRVWSTPKHQPSSAFFIISGDDSYRQRNGAFFVPSRRPRRRHSPQR